MARHLDPSRYRVHAWFLYGDGPLVSELRAAGAEVRVVAWRGGLRNPAGAWRFWQALRREKDRFSIIHEHLLSRSLRLLIRGATSAKLVSHLHVIWHEEKGTHYRLIKKFNFGAHCVIGTSRAAAETVRGARLRVVYPGISVHPLGKSEARDPSRPRVIGTAGRLDPVKGISFLLRAFSFLVPEFPDVRLEIAGEGPLREKLESEAASLDIQSRVMFLGWRKDMPAVFRRWDIYVQPSLMEAFGLAALEAMACGLPVVGTAAGGLPELIVDGETGLLVPPRDSGALAQAIRRLLQNPTEACAMGAAGRARAVKYFSVERMVAEVQKIYDELLNPPGGTGHSTAGGRLSAGAPS